MRKKITGKAFLALTSIATLLFVFGFQAECQAKEMRWFNTLQSGLAYAKKSKKWVFVDIGADW